jgi:hypothetical protein
MAAKRPILKITLLVVAGVIAAILILAATRPDTFTVQRTALIKAPAERIFPLVNDFHRWGDWSPWEKIDPAMKREFSGAPSGKGAKYAWEGNSSVGSGSMEITDSAPPGKIVIRLDFLKPFEARNRTEFTMRPQGDSTEVAWTMTGPVPYLGKIMHMLVSMDKMVGGQFEQGLANLKSIAESGK